MCLDLSKTNLSPPGVYYQSVSFCFFPQRRAEAWALEDCPLAFLVQHCHQAELLSCLCHHLSVQFVSKSRVKKQGINGDRGPKTEPKGAPVIPIQIMGERTSPFASPGGSLYPRAITEQHREVQAWISCGSHICQGGRSPLPRSQQL